MKAKSAKAKGRKLQNLVTETLREAFPSLDKDSLGQAETNCEDRCPVLVFTRNRKPVYAAIPFDELINLIKEKKCTKTPTKSRKRK